MSENLSRYITALETSKKLNKGASDAADVLIGNYRSGIGGGCGMPPGGNAGPAGSTHSGQMMSFGQTAAHGGAPTAAVGTPVYGPCPPEFLCDCDLIGYSTIGLADPNIPLQDRTAAVGPFTAVVTDFDAVALQAVAVWYTAFEAAGPQLIANPVVEVPVNLVDVRVGGNSQLRARGTLNALNSGAFAATREPVCDDWAPFRSQNGQELFLDFENPVAGTNIHIVVVLWCNILQ